MSPELTIRDVDLLVVALSSFADLDPIYELHKKETS